MYTRENTLQAHTQAIQTPPTIFQNTHAHIQYHYQVRTSKKQTNKKGNGREKRKKKQKTTNKQTNNSDKKKKGLSDDVIRIRRRCDKTQ